MFLREDSIDFYKLGKIDVNKFDVKKVEEAIKLHEDLKEEVKGTIMSYLIGLVITLLKKLINHLVENSKNPVVDEAGKDATKRNK